MHASSKLHLQAMNCCSFMQLFSLLFASCDSREVPLVEGPANFVATYWTQGKSGSDPCLAKQNLSECVVNLFPD